MTIDDIDDTRNRCIQQVKIENTLMTKKIYRKYLKH